MFVWKAVTQQRLLYICLSFCCCPAKGIHPTLILGESYSWLTLLVIVGWPDVPVFTGAVQNFYSLSRIFSNTIRGVNLPRIRPSFHGLENFFWYKGNFEGQEVILVISSPVDITNVGDIAAPPTLSGSEWLCAVIGFWGYITV
jgi:hypothetical protein